jgi:hypothetical protein
MITEQNQGYMSQRQTRSTSAHGGLAPQGTRAAGVLCTHRSGGLYRRQLGERPPSRTPRQPHEGATGKSDDSVAPSRLRKPDRAQSVLYS